MLPSGLASISARLDDTPQVRGAVAFGRMVREREETQGFDARVKAQMDRFPTVTASLDAEIQRHAKIAVDAAFSRVVANLFRSAGH